jgi:hypothetical protein
MRRCVCVCEGNPASWKSLLAEGSTSAYILLHFPSSFRIPRRRTATDVICSGMVWCSRRRRCDRHQLWSCRGRRLLVCWRKCVTTAKSSNNNNAQKQQRQPQRFESVKALERPQALFLDANSASFHSLSPPFGQRKYTKNHPHIHRVLSCAHIFAHRCCPPPVPSSLSSTRSR